MTMTTEEGIINLVQSDSDDESAVKKTNSSPPNEKNKSTPKKSDFVEDEDVPSDFFDDFLNNDFMDGLDVVDIWDDECEKKEGRTKKSRSKSRSRSRRRDSRSRRRRSRSGSIFRSRRYREEYRRRGRSRERRSRDKRSRERYTGKGEKDSDCDESNVDHRRDPAKTKRDIQKDKDTCAKKEEEKSISEKLKVVETGLVPPGTELEVDLNDLKPVDPKAESKSKAANREKQRSDSPQKRVDRTSRLYGSKRTYQYTRSPHWRKSRSPLRYSRSPLSKRRRSLERRSRRDYSADRYRRRSRSLSFELSPEPSSNRNREKHTSWSKRSSSNTRDFLEELATKLAKSEKKKYYNKVKEIIAQPPKQQPPHTYHPVPPVPPPGPVPAPIRAPAPYFPQHMDPAAQYDHHFFIGQQFPLNPMHYPHPLQGMPPAVGNHMISQPVAPSMQVERSTSQIPANNFNNTTFDTSNNINVNVQKEKEAIHKLFEDKKISLSDFLSMSAKHADSTEPVNVQKKIKVISLCQDAIKILGNELQLSGRFFLKKAQKEQEKPQEGKLMSPLRRIPIVRFSFTTPSKSGEEKSTMQSTISKLLMSVGVVETLPHVTPTPSPSRVVPEPTRQTVNSPTFKSNHDIIGPTTKSAVLNKMCQTDLKCQVCEVRKSRTFVNKEVQCELNSVSVGTQIAEDDLLRMGVRVPAPDNLKNQSLAHLTPAQLMRNTLSGEDHSRLSDTSPEKPTYRPNNEFNRPASQTNDNFGRQLFGFDKRPVGGGPTFGNNNMFNNPVRAPSTPMFENRSRPFDEGLFKHRNANPPAPIRGVNQGGPVFFEPPRNTNTFPNNPIPNPVSPNKRVLLPNPYVARKY
ncbi:hypothetical protein PPYR_01365 [Photinus pyralis]|uniref:Uncharacterized protein n=2 Tax=Photinus pyralis TaxID=7054 RepID=A0A1Y1MCA9_PHOPY|nr:uncharacterized protein LOC116176053 [Photinus pyralis]KAB0804395.1 hypothetical protein PPYR_01365 [Photinus pyralis]